MRLRLLLALPILLAGCAAAPPRAAQPSDAQVRALEARLAELERKVNAAPPPAAPDAHAHPAPEARQLPQAAFDLLAVGNAAFAAGKPRPGDITPGRVHDLAAGQKPYAVIVSCADSRVGPELVFGAGLGDLFVVRVAGNVIDETALASVEYAVAHLNCRLVVVLGHTACGAVKAAVADAKDTPAVAGLVARIKPAVAEARRGGEADLVDRSVQVNAGRQREVMRHDSQLLAEMEKAGDLRLVTACYDLEDGAVDWLDGDGLALPAAAPARRAPPAVPATPPAPAHGH